MSYLDEKTRPTLWNVLLVAAACVAALVVPFVVASHLTGSSETPPPAGQAGAAVATGGATASTPASSGSGTATHSPAARSSSTPQPTATTSSADLAAATESCRLANLRLSAALGAADVSLAQFDKHIDAMNLLVAGKISYAVATQFWDETRVGATQNAAAFAAADKALRASKPTCRALQAPVANGLPYGSVVAVSKCSSYLSAGNAAMARARTTIRTWNHHIDDMEMLRMGHITPAQATAMWSKNWHTGQKQLRAYESLQQKAKKIGCTLD